ncbi:MAG: TonB family protein [Betaproteobacteria bacterium]|nr:TonB family protein [Betaproteobacteria bacterium]
MLQTPSTRRLLLFVAVSVALHVVTMVGVGPFRIAGLSPGAGFAGFELHATLIPAPVAPVAQPDPAGAPEETAQRDAAPAEDRQGPAPERAASVQPAPEGGLALPSPQKWFTAREVDVRAEPLSSIALPYPEELRGKLVAGKVQLRLFIDERGIVRKMQVAVSDPSGLFDEAAKRAWAEVRFRPAVKDGAPVKSQKVIELTYVPE